MTAPTAARRRQYPAANEVERALCRLARTRTLARLGSTGPLDAAWGADSLYSDALFGRDALMMAMDLLADFPDVARATIEALTHLQGTKVDRKSEEEPGRILHEHRYTAKSRNPHWDYPYYGSVDATPLYVQLVAAYVQQEGPAILATMLEDRRGKPVTVLQGVERAVAWVAGRIRQRGFVYVQRAQPYGLANQVWPDSYDAFYFEDGRLFDPDGAYAPIAVQGYAYDALLNGAALTADKRKAELWRTCAAELRERVLRCFWRPELGTFAVALFYQGRQRWRPSLVVASDPGHLLATQILDGDELTYYREAVRDRLMQPDMLAAAGVRTKSAGAPRFNPGSYHNGSVWPMDNARLAWGLRAHGFVQEADDLNQRLLRGVAQAGSMVEFLRGDLDAEIRTNRATLKVDVLGETHTVEQEPQQLQGWTASCVWRLLRHHGLVSPPCVSS